LPIRLKLSFDEEQQVNFLQSFEQNIASYIEGSRAEKTLTQLLGKSSQVIERLSLKKEKIKLTPRLIARFEKERINGKKITQKAIARITGYCERTVRYRKKQNNKPLQKRGRKRIMDKDTWAFLYLDFLNNNAKTQQERANSIYQEKGIKISQQVISYNLIKDTGFTRKKGAKRYSGLKMEEVRKFLNENGWLYSLPNCLALDEFPTHLGEAPQYAWSREGCPAEIIQTGQKVATYTVMVCIQNIDKQGVISCKPIKNEKKKIKDEKTRKVRIKKGTDAVDFYNFLKNIELPTNKKHYLLLDNASIHSTTDKLRELGLSIEELSVQKNIVLVYFPKYAPQINPVELCNNFIRGRIKSEQPKTEEALKKVIKEAVNFLNNKKDLSQNFRHCRDFFYVVKNGK
jgi:transposase